ncbi:EF-hand calcium-binding domain-containing protein 14 [Gastrophryne carolinensis]
MGPGCVSAGPPAPSTPHKKMKKRRELNALIGLAGDRKKKRPLLGGPRAPDSDSATDTEEYSTDPGRSGHCMRVGMARCCSLCSPVFAFVVLAACVMAVIGLVWMQQALKDNLDLLREQLRTMESSQRNSVQEIPKIKEDLLIEQKRLDELLGGELGLRSNITDLNRQIALLSSAVTQLKANLKSASDLINLPKTMEELQKSVATLGSTLTSVHHDVETLQAAAEEQKKKVETLEADVIGATSKLSPTAAPAAGAHGLPQSLLDDLNATLLYYQQQSDLHLQSIATIVSNISQRVSVLESNVLLKRPLNSSGTDSVQNTLTEEVPGSEIQEQLQLIHALTNNPDSERAADDGRADSGDTVTAATSPVRNFPRSLQRKRQRRSSSPIRLTKQELKELFAETPQGVGGKLTLEELQDRLGGRLDLHSLEEYDEDGDRLFSLAELLSLCSGQ